MLGQRTAATADANPKKTGKSFFSCGSPCVVVVMQSELEEEEAGDGKAF